MFRQIKNEPKIKQEFFEDDEDAIEEVEEQEEEKIKSKFSNKPQASQNSFSNPRYGSYHERNQFKKIKFQSNFVDNKTSVSRNYQATSYTREVESTKKGPPRPRRQWQFTELGEKIEQSKPKHQKIRDAFHFKVVSYNLLAPQLLEDNIYLYNGIDRKYLDWDYRKKNLLKEIKKINSHISCFQEMQADDYESFFKRKLSQMCFETVYKKRGDNKPDGCCIAFRRKSFELIKKVEVDFLIPGVEILNRENVGIVLLLKLINEKTDNEQEAKYLCVATTHILFNPKRGDCKLAQLQLLLANIDRVAYKESKIIDKKLVAVYHPTFLCGDFNSSSESKIYKFLSESKLESYKTLNRLEISGQLDDIWSNFPIENTLLPERLGISDQCQFKQDVDSRYLQAILNNKSGQDLFIECTFGSDVLSHCFNFKSTYCHRDKDGVLEVTSCVKDCHRPVDFILYHSGDKENDAHLESLELDDCYDDPFVDRMNDLELLARLELYNKDYCKDLLIPNKFYSSDHFMLAGRFILT